MPIKDVATTVCFWAEDVANGGGKTLQTGSEITLRLVSDGSVSTPSGSLAEVDATNLPGLYSLAVGSGENDGFNMILGGKSSTADVVIRPVQWTNVVNSAALYGSIQSLIDLKDFADIGYDPVNHGLAAFSALSGTAGDPRNATSFEANGLPARAEDWYADQTLLWTSGDLDGLAFFITESSTDNPPILTVELMPATPDDTDAFIILGTKGS